MTDDVYMQVPDNATLFQFETDKLKSGDVIALYRPTIGEVARWLISEVDGCLLRVVVLLDRAGNDWTGNYMSFAKREIDPKKWRKLVSST